MKQIQDAKKIKRREDNNIIKEKLKIKILKNSERQIILRGDGNRNNNCKGNLVVKLIVKQEEK